MIKLSPSLLSADFSKLDRELKLIEDAGSQYLHLDIMDGHFVPNISFGAPILKSLRPVTKMEFDVHLMITNPERYIPDFVKAGADIINVHAETCPDLAHTIKIIKDLGVRAAVTIKPETPISSIESVLEEIDMALVMTVNPGFSGQKLISEALKKAEILANIRDTKKLGYELEIDGGISLSNVRDVLSTGADVMVAGSAVFGAENPGQAVKEFFDVFKEYE